MREILFRGKRIEDGQWVEGHYHFANWYLPPSMEIVDRTHYILQIGHGDADKIDPETVGQYTGLTDKNGKKIFEGDIIKSDNGKQAAVSVIKFGEYYPKMFYKMLDMFDPGRRHLPSCGFYAESIDKHEEMILFQSPCVEIIGNIHDNPDLLDEK